MLRRIIITFAFMFVITCIIMSLFSMQKGSDLNASILIVVILVVALFTFVLRGFRENDDD